MDVDQSSIQNLSRDKLKLLRQRLRQQKPSTASPSPIAPQQHHAQATSLSFAQQRIWFLSQLAPNGSLYHRTHRLRLMGPLNVHALHQTFTAIIERHTVLRTTYQDSDHGPVQTICSQWAFDLPLLDLRNSAVSDPMTTLESMLDQEAMRPFDLTTDLMLRAILIWVNEGEYVLQMTLHHVASDGWSDQVFFRDLHLLYQAFLGGRSHPLPPLRIQYADFAQWQRQQLTEEKLAVHLHYWVQQLRDAPPALELPTDYPRPLHSAEHGTQLTFQIPPALTTALKQLSQQTDTTLFMVLLTAFKVLLYRYTQQENIVVGTAIANRDRVELEELIGFFANTLVLRTELSGDLSLRTFLSRVRQVALSAYTHQDLPFERLVEELQPDRTLSYAPLFQVMFVWQDGSRIVPQLEGLRLAVAPVQSKTAKFDLTLAMSETAHGLKAILEYRTDLFEPATIARMAGHFQTLLGSIAANPNEVIATLPMLTATEQQQLLGEWNPAPIHQPPQTCIHQLFEAQVQRNPEAIAARWEDQQLSYGELNRRANQLAHYLQTLGVGVNGRVGIWVERSLELLVGILGILKAGGAYVPFDPTYPSERLSFMLEDSQAEWLLTQQRLADHLPKNEAKVICLDTDWDSIAQHLTDNLTDLCTPENLAYIIYTSGSTGKPKGVCIHHANVIRLFTATEPWFHFSDHDVWTLFHSYAFDFSVWEIWGALLHGGRLVIVPYWVSRSPQKFYHLLCQEQVTVLNQTPSAFWQLIQTETERNSPRNLALRWVILGGEALEIQSLKPWFKRHGDRAPQLVNMYGITETTVHVTYRPIILADLQESKGSVIGRPIPDLQVYVLDANQQLCPVGIPGEMYVGGAGVGLGYLGRPELTRRQFLAHPFSADPRARLYRTGDLAKYRPNGDLEYLGRIDRQVKIRGFRIELGEIETILSQHPEVQHCIVVAREDCPGHKQLVAYIVTTAAILAKAEIRRFLQQTLPEYMLPSAFVQLETLPLTSHHKIDLGAFPPPQACDLQFSNQYVAPRTPLEQNLSQIWAQVLKLERVGIYDNFFELGGHSLLATQIIARIRSTLQVEMPLHQLFATPTIAGFGAAVPHHDQPQDLGIPRRKSALVSPLSFAQQRLWFLNQLEPESTAYYMTQTIRLRGLLNIAALQQALSTIVARHESLRTTFVATDGIPMQAIASSAVVELPLCDLKLQDSDAPEIALKFALQQAADRPFDLTADLMLRAALISLSEQEHILQLTLHHIAIDGWSMDILMRELSALYLAFSDGQPNPLPELPIQYADFAEWQRQQLQGEDLESDLAYWRKTLAGMVSLTLPTDYPRPALPTHRSQCHTLVLSPQLTEALTALSQAEGTTLFVVLLAAFKVLLARLSGQDDIVIGSPIAGRNRVETEALIGCFVNTVVLRTNLRDQPSFRTLVSRVQQVVLGAHAHQELPFEKLVEDLQPERDLSRSSLFQVWVNMFPQEKSPLELVGLETELIASIQPTSKFDLTLYIEQQQGNLGLRLLSNADLFSAARMDELLLQYELLLQQIVVTPERSIGQFSLVTPRQAVILPDPTAILSRRGPEQTIYEAFVHQSQRLPQKVAVVDGQRSWTYETLNLRSNQLAHTLRQSGIQSQDVVAIYGTRQLALVWAILGVLKAGAAIVLLDPTYPTERLVNSLNLVNPKGWLRLNAHEVLPSDLDSIVANWPWRCDLSLPADDSTVPGWLTQAPSTELTEVVDPAQPAYIVLTSGSTGQPKAIIGTHRPVSHFLNWYSRTFSLRETDRFSCLSGLAHDPILRDIFTPLSIGATLYIPNQAQREDPHRLLSWMQQCQITVSHLTPALAQWLCQGTTTKSETPLCPLRYACFGGDVLTQKILSDFRKLAPFATVINGYGATETPQLAGYFWVDAFTSQIALNHRIPIGQGIEDVQLLILNPVQMLAGVGELGEIYVRTPYLSQGYLQDEPLNGDRFLTNRFTEDPQDIYYKTGDLGRYLPDGNIEFLGRIDNQVKIRGFRIELGDVEWALSQHPAVQQCAVIVREDEPDNKRLVAYVVAIGLGIPEQRDFRQFLLQKLPEHMIPSVFVPLDTLPLTANGKLDRLALPQSGIPNPQTWKTYTVSRTPIEKDLAEIWVQVLKLEGVGIHDNFFELGGHSLLAVQLFARIERIFGQKLPLSVLFQSPTIAQLATFLHRQNTSDIWSPLVEIQTGGANPPLFCMHGGGFNVLIYRQLAMGLGAEQPVYGLQARGLEGNQPYFTCLEDIAIDYIRELRKIQPHGPYYLAGLSSGGHIAFEMAQQLLAQGEKIALLALFDTRTSQGMQLLPSLPRFVSALSYFVGYSIPRFIKRSFKANPAEISLDLRQKVQELGQRTWPQQNVPPKLFLERSAPLIYVWSSVPKLRWADGIDQISQYILEHSPWAFLSQKGLLPDLEDSVSTPLRQLQESYRKIHQAYIPQPYTGKITLFRAMEDPPGFRRSADLGWGTLARGGLEVYTVSGHHVAIMHSQALAQQLKLCLERALWDCANS